jgi:hypothetical protein
MSNEVMWRVQPSKKFPWRERSIVYLTLLSYSLWARKIFRAYFPSKSCSSELTN